MALLYIEGVKKRKEKEFSKSLVSLAHFFREFEFSLTQILK